MTTDKKEKRGNMMKLYICPICFKVVDGVGMLQFEVNGFSDCPYCGHEIIPLATPQVCRHSNEDDYKGASLYQVVDRNIYVCGDMITRDGVEYDSIQDAIDAVVVEVR